MGNIDPHAEHARGSPAVVVDGALREVTSGFIGPLPIAQSTPTTRHIDSKNRTFVRVISPLSASNRIFN
ncbi:hypothetical protein [Paraburkholderia bannensis]|uniref:hypothetical protein n=1 Tax=Paraburkholderia bannensis TaxID=765414 RepID=UPI002AB7871D|nr:hypothetical protein [Paraburkholderia bannensis]